MTESQTASTIDLSRVPIQDRSVRRSVAIYHDLVSTANADQVEAFVGYCTAEAAHAAVRRYSAGFTAWQYLALAAYWRSIAEAVARRDQVTDDSSNRLMTALTEGNEEINSERD